MIKENENLTSNSVNSSEGLSNSEVELRSKEFGYNEVPEIKASPLKAFLKKFWGITPWMLEFTIILNFILGKDIEASIILGLLIFNAIVGFVQEKNANSAISVLKQKLQIKARVKRNKEWILIPIREIVPGDLIRLRAGDIVPADVNIVNGFAEVDQSSITGESMEVEKLESNMLYSSSIIKEGEITGIVNKTGNKTRFGRTIELVQIAKPKHHIQMIISMVVKWLLIIVLISLIILIVLSLLENISFIEMIPLIAILLVATIPVALPTMFVISMALGSLELSKRGVLIVRLDSLDDVSTMNVLCLDKTGTLTLNKLSIIDVIPSVGYNENDVLLYGALASQKANQDPIDLAFLEKVEKNNISLNYYNQKEFTPFDPKNRRTSAIIEKDNEQFMVLKGALNVITNLCKNGQTDLKKFEKEIEIFVTEGFRLLAVAYGTDTNELRLIGIVALYDKIRKDTPKLIKTLQNLGITIKILTGDSLPIAKEIAKEIQLENNIIQMSDLEKKFDTENNYELLEKSSGFAEIYPEDKYKIVKEFQNLGYIVGMTGDGINDAPALKQAEVGIAVSNATDVAKKASSVVLTTEGLEGIVNLVISGRMIFQRISTYIMNKIIKTFNVVLFIILSFIITGIYIVSALDVIVLLFLSDYITLAFSTDKVKYSEKPESWNINWMVKVCAILGILIVFEGLILLFIGNSLFRIFDDIDRLHTFVLVFLVFSGSFTVLSIRERKHFWHSKPSKTLGLALIINSIIVILISTLGIPGIKAISLIEIIIIIVYSFVFCLLLNDFVKNFLINKINKVF